MTWVNSCYVVPSLSFRIVIIEFEYAPGLWFSGKDKGIDCGLDRVTRANLPLTIVRYIMRK